MTTILAKKGQIVIPKAIREHLGLQPGDDFEVYLLDGEIVLRPMPKRRNEGLAGLLRNPPGTLAIAPREQKLEEALDLS